MTVWFTADHHFQHANIIQFCSRPFVDAEAMDDAMVANWNRYVAPDDTVWHLGDFAVTNKRVLLEGFFSRLNGRKHLIVGNHDGKDTCRLGWQSINELAEVTVDDQRIVLCHYGLRVWPGLRRGAIHLYGHSHGRLPGTSRSLDVGVDEWSFTPVCLPEILDRLKSLPDVEPESEPLRSGAT
jgi:calcineurin-like phosphoesterase family protein